ncbi:uncharacterized protein LOC126578088 [Anopheles aquasalis]|uniref:uncharacterized protein LOC126578088 n=1 Tax=Anopheles aquasalis TaxID=42839 RepID=UPI00215AD70E|nr:uncharacterized protein LOC126578088 [Anopheles aquasalis]
MDTFLLEFARKFPCENKFQAVLKSALFTHSLKREALPVQQYRTRCRKCNVPWEDGFFTVTLLPPSKQCLRQIEKYESMTEPTKQQLSLLKYFKSRTRRIAKYTCSICSFKTRVRLDQKTVLQKPQNDSAISMVTEEIEEQKRKKRKRHGKSNAGLTIPTSNSNSKGELSVTPGPLQSSANKAPPQTLLNRKAKQFKPQDFREIQKLLAARLAGTADTKSSKKKPRKS